MFSCVFMRFLHFFDMSNRSNRLEVDLDWGRGSRGGTGPCCGDTLALPITQEKWLSGKQPSSMEKFPRLAKQETFQKIQYLLRRKSQCQFVQWDHVSLELSLILVT